MKLIFLSSGDECFSSYGGGVDGDIKVFLNLVSDERDVLPNNAKLFVTHFAIFGVEEYLNEAAKTHTHISIHAIPVDPANWSKIDRAGMAMRIHPGCIFQHNLICSFPICQMRNIDHMTMDGWTSPGNKLLRNGFGIYFTFEDGSPLRVINDGAKWSLTIGIVTDDRANQYVNMNCPSGCTCFRSGEVNEVTEITDSLC